MLDDIFPIQYVFKKYIILPDFSKISSKPLQIPGVHHWYMSQRRKFVRLF
jgi:hypothetical protein